MACGTVERSPQGNVWVLLLSGEHDLSTAPALRHELKRAFAAGSAVVVDLEHVEFMDSTILAQLWHGREQARQHAEHGFAVAAPPGSAARRLLELVALDEAVPVFDDIDDAMAAAKAQQAQLGRPNPPAG